MRYHHSRINIMLNCAAALAEWRQLFCDADLTNRINKCNSLIINFIKFGGTVKLMRTRIELLAQPKYMHSMIDATQREQQHGLAKPDRFMTYVNAPFMKKVLHIAERKRKSNVHHYCKSDYFRAGFEVAE